MPDWNKLSPDEFERICFRLLYKEGFQNIKKYGGPGDRGRDHVGEYVVKTGSYIELFNYLIQCKRYTAKKSLSVSDIDDCKDWMDAHNEYQRALIIASVYFSAETRDWLQGINETARYKIDVWDSMELENRLARYPDLLYEYFPPVKVVATEIIPSFRTQHPDPVLCCELKFQTSGGPIVFDQSITGLSAISGSATYLSVELDGKKSNLESVHLTSLPSFQREVWGKQDIPAGEHTAKIYCENLECSFEIIKSEIRVIELPKVSDET